MRNIFLSSIALVMAFLISISGICAAGFFEESHAASSEPGNILQIISHAHAEEHHSESHDAHCVDEIGEKDTTVSRTTNIIQNQISNILENPLIVAVSIEDATRLPLQKSERLFLASHALQRHIRSVVMRF